MSISVPSLSTDLLNNFNNDGMTLDIGHLSLSPCSTTDGFLFNESLHHIEPCSVMIGVSNPAPVSTSYFDIELFCYNNKPSLNVTDYVSVPSSEHVAEIVGRQGCKIKALRNRTNTYIKTPARGERPVFVITGRRTDVMQAKSDILMAAEHFTHIRASRGGQSRIVTSSSPPPSISEKFKNDTITNQSVNNCIQQNGLNDESVLHFDYEDTYSSASHLKDCSSSARYGDRNNFADALSPTKMQNRLQQNTTYFCSSLDSQQSMRDELRSATCSPLLDKNKLQCYDNSDFDSSLNITYSLEFSNSSALASLAGIDCQNAFYNNYTDDHVINEEINVSSTADSLTTDQNDHQSKDRSEVASYDFDIINKASNNSFTGSFDSFAKLRTDIASYNKNADGNDDEDDYKKLLPGEAESLTICDSYKVQCDNDKQDALSPNSDLYSQHNDENSKNVTVQLRVPYRIVGLVVGPKGATIKRIQQNTHTYIVTPCKDKDPVFEITGHRDSVIDACKQIEAHVISRTGSDLVNKCDQFITDVPGTSNLSNNFKVRHPTHTIKTIVTEYDQGKDSPVKLSYSAQPRYHRHFTNTTLSSVHSNENMSTTSSSSSSSSSLRSHWNEHVKIDTFTNKVLDRIITNKPIIARGLYRRRSSFVTNNAASNLVGGSLAPHKHNVNRNLHIRENDRFTNVQSYDEHIHLPDTMNDKTSSTSQIDNHFSNNNTSSESCIQPFFGSFSRSDDSLDFHVQQQSHYNQVNNYPPLIDANFSYKHNAESESVNSNISTTATAEPNLSLQCASIHQQYHLIDEQLLNSLNNMYKTSNYYDCNIMSPNIENILSWHYPLSVNGANVELSEMKVVTSHPHISFAALDKNSIVKDNNDNTYISRVDVVNSISKDELDDISLSLALSRQQNTQHHFEIYPMTEKSSLSIDGSRDSQVQTHHCSTNTVTTIGNTCRENECKISTFNVKSITCMYSDNCQSFNLNDSIVDGEIVKDVTSSPLLSSKCDLLDTIDHVGLDLMRTSKSSVTFDMDNNTSYQNNRRKTDIEGNSALVSTDFKYCKIQEHGNSTTHSSAPTLQHQSV